MNVKTILTFYGVYALGVYGIQRFTGTMILPQPPNILLDPLGTLLGYPVSPAVTQAVAAANASPAMQALQNPLSFLGLSGIRGL